MATYVVSGEYCLVNTVDLSDHVTEVTLTYEADAVETTAMGTTAAKSFIAGLTSWKVDVDFQQDFASAKVDATLTGLIGAAAFAIEVRPATGNRSTTNPGYNGNCILTSYPILAGAKGDLAKTRVSFQGTGALARSTA